MNISYEGIGYLALNMPEMDSVEGHVCAISQWGDVVCCESGQQFFGVVETVKNYMACVQVEGFVKLPYTGTEPTAGFIKLVADGNGGVMMSDNGRTHLVVQVDSDNQKLVMKL